MRSNQVRFRTYAAHRVLSRSPPAQPEHKIQSRDLRSGSFSDAASRGLSIQLAPVPKMLVRYLREFLKMVFAIPN
jgi:hypothetical protein